MIKPVGSDTLQPLFVYDSDKHDALSHEAESLPSVVISSQAAGNAVMMGAGYFNPLRGYMNVADAMGAAEKMTLTDGSFFPVPVMCLVQSTDAIGDAKRIALRDPNVEGSPVLAVMDIENIETVSDEQMRVMTEKVYRTTDPEHPGVAAFNTQGRIALSGPIQVLNFSYFITDFPDTFRTAVEIRNEIAERGWRDASGRCDHRERVGAVAVACVKRVVGRHDIAAAVDLRDIGPGSAGHGPPGVETRAGVPDIDLHAVQSLSRRGVGDES